MMFPKNSAFDDERSRREREQHPLFKIDPDQTVSKVEHDLPLEHWHHDLVTVDILLEQSPPDITRAREMLRDIGHEIQRNLR